MALEQGDWDGVGNPVPFGGAPYVYGMNWNATASGSLDGVDYRPGDRIYALGDSTSSDIPEVDVEFRVLSGRDFYKHGMWWVATSTGTIDGQDVEPGDRIYSVGDVSADFLLPSELFWAVEPARHLYKDGMTWKPDSDGYVGGRPVKLGETVTAEGDRNAPFLGIRDTFFRITRDRSRGPGNIIRGTGPPSADIVQQFEANVVRSKIFVDIYESDDTTLWRSDVPVIDGSVAVDRTRAERRNLDITIKESEGLHYGPGGFWYDKIIKPYRGIQLANGDSWVIALGSFIPENVEQPRFPNTMSASCIDFSSKLSAAGFDDVTTFVGGTPVREIIQAIASNGGISKFSFEPIPGNLGTDATFDAGSSRMTACIELALAIGCEVYFDQFGYMVLRQYVDPLRSAASYQFRTGTTGNLVNFNKSTNKSLLRNDIIVKGSGASNGLVYGRAVNTEPESPTRVLAVGRRTEVITNSFVRANGEAMIIADRVLRVSSLEQYDVNLESLMIPWLEAGDAVEAILPDADTGEPSRFLMSSFTIPLAIGSMSANVKRVTIV